MLETQQRLGLCSLSRAACSNEVGPSGSSSCCAAAKTSTSLSKRRFPPRTVCMLLIILLHNMAETFHPKQVNKSILTKSGFGAVAEVGDQHSCCSTRLSIEPHGAFLADLLDQLRGHSPQMSFPERCSTAEVSLPWLDRKVYNRLIHALFS